MKLLTVIMNPMSCTRRRWLQISVLAAVGSRLGRSAEKRPNILFCISDDQSYPHASAYGADWLKTPGFDRVAREGALFHNCFVSTPSCCPSRGSVLSGQDFYRLREASMNHTIWPKANDIPLYTDLLGEAGYLVGYTGKGWAPGNWKIAGRADNPAGPVYNDIKTTPPATGMSSFDYAANFDAFLDKRNAEQPFCFWAGFVEPHRVFEEGSGKRLGHKPNKIPTPGFYPEADAIQSDLADYAAEIEYYDGHLTRMLDSLERRGELDNTIVVVTSDNGMAFPRAKATVYDSGARMPLAVRWGDRVQPGRVVDDFVSFVDFAPTFLEAAGIAVPKTVTGRSLLPVLEADPSGRIDPDRDFAVFGIERHLPGSRAEGAGYPIRAIRTADYLYIRNLTPDAPPVGEHPGVVWPDDDPTGGFGDTDGSPTKTYLWEQRDKHKTESAMAFGPRPAEQLFDVRRDPSNLRNLAEESGYAEIKRLLAAKLDDYLRRTDDPRAHGRGDELDEVMKRYPVLGSN